MGSYCPDSNMCNISTFTVLTVTYVTTLPYCTGSLIFCNPSSLLLTVTCVTINPYCTDSYMCYNQSLLYWVTCIAPNPYCTDSYMCNNPSLLYWQLHMLQPIIPLDTVSNMSNSQYNQVNTICKWQWHVQATSFFLE